MPNGGSVTPASMLPIMMFAAVYGVGPGMLTGMVYGILQCLQGGGIMAAGGFAQFALDYLLAFAVLGLAGIARNFDQAVHKDKVQGSMREILSSCGLYIAFLIAALARLACHTAAGVLFWDTAPWASFVYNISYLGPDTVICILLAIFIAKPVMRIMKTQ